MTVAAAIENRTAQATAWSKPSRVAAVDVLADLSQAEVIWCELDEQQAVPHPISTVGLPRGLAAPGQEVMVEGVLADYRDAFANR